MAVCINLENTRQFADSPTLTQLQQWVDETLHTVSAPQHKQAVNICLLDGKASAKLNKNYRNKKGPTNVLSFPDENIPGFESNSLGDLALCAPLVAEEAQAQNKTVEAHYAHLVVHGILHLLGYDHIEEKETKVMEGLEVTILKKLGYNDPYPKL